MSDSPNIVRDLKPSTMQTWTLIGMSPIHRGLVMRTVRSIQSAKSAQPPHAVPLRNAASKVQLQWTQIDLLSVAIANRKQSVKLGQTVLPSIVIVGKKSLNETSSSELLDWLACCSRSVLLLWSWSTTDWKDHRWASEIGFAGIIHDITSLEQWLGSCLRSGPVHESVASSLLADISLPQVGR
jgi:hypothetical protein